MNPSTVRGILRETEARIRRERKTKADQLEWARKEAARREAERVAFCAEHGALVWRAMLWYGRNQFVTDLLRSVQSIGYLTPAQINGLRKTITFLERTTKGGA